MTTGKSPPAHSFIGDLAAATLDLHSGAPLVEVTAEVTQTPAAQLKACGSSTGSSLTTTLNLSNVNLDHFGFNLGLGAGVFPSSFTIFARGHSKYDGSVPATNTSYTFASSAGATSSSGGALFNASTDDVVGNPSSAVCTDGVFP